MSQIGDDGVKYAVAYVSHTNTPAKSAFCSYEREVSDVYWVVQRFRYYLWGRPFRLITDCKAMEWLVRTLARLRSKLARWSMVLSKYELEIVHRPGANNVVPGYTSRHHVKQTQPRVSVIT